MTYLKLREGTVLLSCLRSICKMDDRCTQLQESVIRKPLRIVLSFVLTLQTFEKNGLSWSDRTFVRAGKSRNHTQGMADLKETATM